MTLSALVLTAAVTAGQRADVPPVFADCNLLISTYHHKPDPARAAAVFDRLVADKGFDNPFLASEPHRFLLTAHAFGHMARGKPDLSRKYEAAFPGLSDGGRRFVLTALAIGGDATSKGLVEKWQADPKFAGVKSELAATHKALAAEKRPLARDKPGQSPDDLDLLWVDFLITGDYAPVSRILDVLDRPAATPGDQTLRRVAIWSAKSNLQQHPKMAELLTKHQGERAKGPEQSGTLVAQWLDELKNGPRP